MSMQGGEEEAKINDAIDVDMADGDKVMADENENLDGGGAVDVVDNDLVLDEDGNGADDMQDSKMDDEVPENGHAMVDTEEGDISNMADGTQSPNAAGSDPELTGAMEDIGDGASQGPKTFGGKAASPKVDNIEDGPDAAGEDVLGNVEEKPESAAQQDSGLDGTRDARAHGDSPKTDDSTKRPENTEPATTADVKKPEESGSGEVGAAGNEPPDSDAVQGATTTTETPGADPSLAAQKGQLTEAAPRGSTTDFPKHDPDSTAPDIAPSTTAEVDATSAPESFALAPADFAPAPVNSAPAPVDADPDPIPGQAHSEPASAGSGATPRAAQDMQGGDGTEQPAEKSTGSAPNDGAVEPAAAAQQPSADADQPSAEAASAPPEPAQPGASEAAAAAPQIGEPKTAGTAGTAGTADTAGLQQPKVGIPATAEDNAESGSQQPRELGVSFGGQVSSGADAEMSDRREEAGSGIGEKETSLSGDADDKMDTDGGPRSTTGADDTAEASGLSEHARDEERPGITGEDGNIDMETPPELIQLERTLENAAETLNQIAITVTNFSFDHQNTLFEKINLLATELKDLDLKAQSVNTNVPFRVLEAIDKGRNPLIVTQQLMEMCSEANDVARAKLGVMKTFSEALSKTVAESPLADK